MINRLIWPLFWIVSLLAANAFAQSSNEDRSDLISQSLVKTQTHRQSAHRLNAFQIDCLNLIRPPSMTFKNIEIYPSSVPSRYFLRIVGQAHPDTRVSVEENEVWTETKKGQFIRRRFQPEAFQGVNKAGAEFRLTLLVSAEDRLTLPLRIYDKIEQRYRLVIQMSETGKIVSSVLDPVIDTEIRKKLCPRNRASFSMGLYAGDYSQSLDRIKGEISASSQSTSSLAVEVSLQTTPVSEHRIHVGTLPWKMPTGMTLQEDLGLNGYEASYHLHRSNMDWIFEKGGWIFRPSYHYGFGLYQLPLLSFEKADQAQVQALQFLTLSAGGGSVLFSSGSWRLETTLSAASPIWNNRSVQFKPLFSADVNLQSALGEETFIGLRTGVTWASGEYQDLSGLSPSGKWSTMGTTLQVSVGWLF